MLFMPATKTLVCWSCKESVELPEKVTRTSNCPKCDQPLKCCYNCRFYDRDAYHQCTEPQAEWVRYKEKANFCEYFTPRVPVSATVAPPAAAPSKSNKSTNGNGGDGKPQKDKLKSAWDSLFKE
jgi:hypothetical protein